MKPSLIENAFEVKIKVKHDEANNRMDEVVENAVDVKSEVQHNEANNSIDEIVIKEEHLIDDLVSEYQFLNIIGNLYIQFFI